MARDSADPTDPTAPSPEVPIELRILTGPNLYFAKPAAKLTLDATAALAADTAEFLGWQRALGVRGHTVGLPDSPTRAESAAELAAAVVRKVAGTLRRRLAAVARVADPVDGRETVVVAYPFRHRDLAEAVGYSVAVAYDRITSGRATPAQALAEAAAAVKDVPPGEVIDMLRPTVPVIAVTGTNGKTTTTRLIAHLAKTAGLVPGWSSTDGIVIDGEVVESGDWSGPGGAARVLSEPRVQVAVTETARGGILLRGVGTPANDISVVTNISADHLGTLGVHTIEQLAEVKSVVPRITKPSGWAVLNADDDLVREMARLTRARVWFYSLDPEHPALDETQDAGGRGITVIDGDVVVLSRGLDPTRVIAVADVPLTLGGASRVNVSNVLAGTAAALALGVPLEAVREGLASFAGDAEHNAGRLNTYLLPSGEDPVADGTVVILDLAHNEASVASLLEVAANLRRPGGEIVAVVSTAGDRADEAIHGMGQLAAAAADRMVIAEKAKYLRGREAGEMTTLWLAGAAEAGVTDAPAYPDELTALTALLDDGLPAGSVIAVCALEQRAEMAEEIGHRGGSELTAEQIRQRVLPTA